MAGLLGTPEDLTPSAFLGMESSERRSFRRGIGDRYVGIVKSPQIEDSGQNDEQNGKDEREFGQALPFLSSWIPHDLILLP
jgi:hypothetical protein